MPSNLLLGVADLIEDEVVDAVAATAAVSVPIANIGPSSTNLAPLSTTDVQKVTDYFGGLEVVPYRFGAMADQFRIEQQGLGSEVSLVRWQYTSTDTDHKGVFDFTVVNEGLSGETYALIEAEDSVKGSGPVQSFSAASAPNSDVWSVGLSGLIYHSYCVH